MVVHTTSAEETEGFGAELARARPQFGDLFGVLYLTGDLGAGKTTLARGFLRALGVKGAVRSPTYTLVEIYEMGTLTALHLDLYRLSDAAELDNLGVREWAKGGHLWLVEWPERGADRLPAADLVVNLTAGMGGHDIQVVAKSPMGRSWLERIAPQTVEKRPTAS